MVCVNKTLFTKTGNWSDLAMGHNWLILDKQKYQMNEKVLKSSSHIEDFKSNRTADNVRRENGNRALLSRNKWGG